VVASKRSVVLINYRGEACRFGVLRRRQLVPVFDAIAAHGIAIESMRSTFSVMYWRNYLDEPSRDDRSRASNLNVAAEQLRIFGGVEIALPDGTSWTESRPQVALVLTNSEFRVEQRFGWMSWTTLRLARTAPQGDPSARKYLWSARWQDITEVHLRRGFLGVRAPGQGSCRFNTGSRSAARHMSDFLQEAGVQFEPVHPTRGFIRRWPR